MKKFLLTAFLAAALLTSQAHVILDYPQGGETFVPGQVITIEWHILIAHDTRDWDLYYSNDGGTTWMPIREDIGVDTLSYDWTIPDESGSMTRVRVVMDNTGLNYTDESGDFTISGPSGVSESNDFQGIKVFPNPASGQIYIDNDKPYVLSGIQLVDLQGRIVRTFLSREQTLTGRYRLPLEGVKPGVYGILFSRNEQRRIEKVLIN